MSGKKHITRVVVSKEHPDLVDDTPPERTIEIIYINYREHDKSNPQQLRIPRCIKDELIEVLQQL